MKERRERSGWRNKAAGVAAISWLMYRAVCRGRKGAKAEANQQYHQRKAQTDTEEMRHAGAHAVVHAGRHDHDIIGAWRDRCWEGEKQHGDENFHNPPISIEVCILGLSVPLEAAEKQGIQGRVSILFTIDTNGEISSIKKRGPSEILENEAVRIIERLPKMQPGKHKGETVNVPFAIPITFKLKDQAKDENEQTHSNKGEMKVGGILANKDNASLFIGKVTDEESMGIPGVTISVVGKNEDVISGFDGHFKIVVNEGETLKFQYIGLPNKLVRVDKKEFLIGLLEKANAENKS